MVYMSKKISRLVTSQTGNSPSQTETIMYAQKIINSLDVESKLRVGESLAVEEFMRTEYGTLDHLSKTKFRNELIIYLSLPMVERDMWIKFSAR